MKRSYLLDNAKFVLILLVVFGHVIEYVKGSSLFSVTYLFIYSFHMPAFVIISGMLSRPNMGGRYLNKTIKSILIPFFVFSVLYEALYFAIEGHASKYITGLEPYWIMWFFLSLFLWRLLLPIVLRFRFPILVLLVLSLGAGYLDFIGRPFGLSRTIYFFPFFLIGHKLTPDFISSFKLDRIPKIVPTIFIVMNVAFFFQYNEIPRPLLYGADGYNDMELSSALLRLGIYGLSFVTAMSVILLIPRKEVFFSKIGTNTMQAYVWHILFIKALTITGISQMVFNMPDNMAMLALFTISAILTVTLSIRFVAVFTDKFILTPVSRTVGLFTKIFLHIVTALNRH